MVGIPSTYSHVHPWDTCPKIKLMMKTILNFWWDLEDTESKKSKNEEFFVLSFSWSCTVQGGEVSHVSERSLLDPEHFGFVYTENVTNNKESWPDNGWRLAREVLLFRDLHSYSYPPQKPLLFSLNRSGNKIRAIKCSDFRVGYPRECHPVSLSPKRQLFGDVREWRHDLPLRYLFSFCCW